MSRSNNTDKPNPSVKFFDWAGSNGTLSYYDKEKKEKVSVPMPFTFILLDQLSTIKGYSNDDEKGIFSNEVKDTKKDVLNVRVFEKGTFAKGLYQDIKDVVVSRGGKYAQSCYIAFVDEASETKELKIGNVMFSGSSLGGGENKKEKYEVGAWMDFSKSNRAELYKKAVKMEKDDRVCVNGATQFYCPKFKLIDVKEETNAKALELDKELQDYLKAYFERNNTPIADPLPADQTTTPNTEESFSQQSYKPQVLPLNEMPDDDLPF